MSRIHFYFRLVARPASRAAAGPAGAARRRPSDSATGRLRICHADRPARPRPFAEKALNSFDYITESQWEKLRFPDVPQGNRAPEFPRSGKPPGQGALFLSWVIISFNAKFARRAGVAGLIGRA
jgi:hypothetical protein